MVVTSGKGMARMAWLFVSASVIASVAIGFSLTSFPSLNPNGGNPTSPSITTSNDTSIGGQSICASSVPNDPLANPADESASNFAHQLLNGTWRSLVFILTPGSTSTLCVRWPSTQGGSYSGSVDSVAVTYVHGLGGTGEIYNYSSAPHVTITDNMTSPVPTLPNDQIIDASFTVAYTISASIEANGFYTIGYPLNCPGFLPLAVVTSSQSINASDFQGYFGDVQCAAGAPAIVGFNGMGAMWIGSNTESASQNSTGTTK